MKRSTHTILRRIGLIPMAIGLTLGVLGLTSCAKPTPSAQGGTSPNVAAGDSIAGGQSVPDTNPTETFTTAETPPDNTAEIAVETLANVVTTLPGPDADRVNIHITGGLGGFDVRYVVYRSGEWTQDNFTGQVPPRIETTMPGVPLPTTIPPTTIPPAHGMLSPQVVNAVFSLLTPELASKGVADAPCPNLADGFNHEFTYIVGSSQFTANVCPQAKTNVPLLIASEALLSEMNVPVKAPTEVPIMPAETIMANEPPTTQPSLRPTVPAVAPAMITVRETGGMCKGVCPEILTQIFENGTWTQAVEIIPAATTGTTPPFSGTLDAADTKKLFALLTPTALDEIAKLPATEKYCPSAADGRDHIYAVTSGGAQPKEMKATDCSVNLRTAHPLLTAISDAYTKISAINN
jgi:hypothetical protein